MTEAMGPIEEAYTDMFYNGLDFHKAAGFSKQKKLSSNTIMPSGKRACEEVARGGPAEQQGRPACGWVGA